ncbi:hypothetical protein QCA50_003056 [Cerrena zonata]|uniref:CTLH/CRA C-terminal to LisH motif domain-containing protein n=1 Tax=Cerrena zonata TaxID=2478898 RepID=A0AAW0GJF4_9APHY
MPLVSWRPKEQPVETEGRSMPTPDGLRALVLDFLCHNGYSETARAFVRDSAVRHLDADGDEVMSASDGQEAPVDVLASTLDERLALGERRKEVRMHILSGNIEEATILLNRYFPTVLSPDNETLDETPNSMKPKPCLRYIPSTSVDPDHLALNLRIQSFIEASRTVPLPFSCPLRTSTLFSPPASPQSLKSSPKLSKSDVQSEPNEELLSRAQSLHAEAHCLPKPEDRSKYIEEITSRLCALLAYPIPEEQPELEGYLSFQHREAVADQIDSAILYRLKQLPISKIELAVRYTSTLFAAPAAYNLDVKLPPKAHRPADTQVLQSWLDSVSKPEAFPVSVGVKKSVLHERDSTEAPFPAFDLTQFLDVKS